MLIRIAGLVVLFCYAGACSRTDEVDRPPAAASESTHAPKGCLENTVTLASLGEPPLRHFSDSTDTEVVRFVWLPSFHSSISVRAIRRGDAHALVSARSPVLGDSGPPPPPERDSVRIDAAMWSRLTRPLTEDVFWIPEPLPPAGVIQVDGSIWWVDRLAGRQCRGLRYRSPETVGPGAAMRAFGILMLQAARITPDEIY